MTALLSILTVVSWGAWIPAAQLIAGIPQRTRTLYAAGGNLVFASAAFAIEGSRLAIGWRTFWLPFLGGMVWTIGSLCAFRATQQIGLARAAGTWTPLNIVTSFVWGAALFAELSGLGTLRWAALAVGAALVGVGITVVVRSQDAGARSAPPGERGAGPRAGGRTYRVGLLYGVGAGLLWGSYFVPAQWAKVPAQAANLPLAFGIFAAAVVLMLPRGAPIRVAPGASAVQLTAGVLFGVGDLALLALVPRVGTGTGFTIAQLSLLVNATIGIWAFKVPPPGTPGARRVLLGVVTAAAGGCLIGALH